MEKYKNFEHRIKMEWALVQEILIFENFNMGYYVVKRASRDGCIAKGLSAGDAIRLEIFLNVTIV